MVGWESASLARPSVRASVRQPAVDDGGHTENTAGASE